MGSLQRNLEEGMERASVETIAPAVPDEVKGWSWAAFLMSWIWAIGNRVWIGLLALPFTLIIDIVLGIKGNEWAWRSRKWESVEQFKKVQLTWAIWGWVIRGLQVAVVILLIVPALAMMSLKPVGPSPARTAGMGGEVIAVVNREKVYGSMLEERFSEACRRVNDQGATPNESLIRASVFNYIVDGVLVTQAARREGIKVSRREIERRTDSLIDRQIEVLKAQTLGSESATDADLHAELQKMGSSLAEVRSEIRESIDPDLLRREMLLRKLIERREGTKALSPEEYIRELRDSAAIKILDHEMRAQEYMREALGDSSLTSDQRKATAKLAAEELRMALQEAEGDSGRQARLYSRLGYLYAELYRGESAEDERVACREEAKKSLLSALKYTEAADLRLMLAGIYTEQGDYVSAVEHLESASMGAPDEPETHAAVLAAYEGMKGKADVARLIAQEKEWISDYRRRTDRM
jgi:tetratricopeptide (TPR) repeat protein